MDNSKQKPIPDGKKPTLIGKILDITLPRIKELLKAVKCQQIVVCEAEFTDRIEITTIFYKKIRSAKPEHS